MLLFLTFLILFSLFLTFRFDSGLSMPTLPKNPVYILFALLFKKQKQISCSILEFIWKNLIMLCFKFFAVALSVVIRLLEETKMLQISVDS